MISPVILLALAASVTVPQGENPQPRPLPEGNSTSIVRILPLDYVENTAQNGAVQNAAAQKTSILDTASDALPNYIAPDNMAISIPRPMPKPMPRPKPFDAKDAGAAIQKNTAAKISDSLILDDGTNDNYGTVEIHKVADNLYTQRKASLDEKFSRMFEIKSELDGIQNQQGEKWDEYYALRNAYEKQLKRLIADWVMLQAE